MERLLLDLARRGQLASQVVGGRDRQIAGEAATDIRRRPAVDEGTFLEQRRAVAAPAGWPHRHDLMGSEAVADDAEERGSVLRAAGDDRDLADGREGEVQRSEPLRERRRVAADERSGDP